MDPNRLTDAENLSTPVEVASSNTERFDRRRKTVVKLRLNQREFSDLLGATGGEDLAVWVRLTALAAAKPGRARRAKERYELALAVVYAGNQVRDLSDLLEDRKVCIPVLTAKLLEIHKSLQLALRHKKRSGQV